ncbi:MAG: GDSL-type esterase/lipase family protein [Acutalibacteraceae bacterium]|jgi:acyl-CoA thioesterase-1
MNVFRKLAAVLLCTTLLLPAMAVPYTAAAATVKIACVGDSITAGSQASSSAYHYPTQLQALLGSGYDVRNFGTSGRTLLSRGDNPYVNDNNFTNSKNFAPDYVTIMLGTNDSKPQNWSHKADFEGDMKAMIETYRALPSHPVVIVCTSPTVGATNIGISEAVVTGEIVPLQKKVAAEMGCPVIDINALTKNAPQNYADGIHPNDAGYTAMAKMFCDGLQDIFTAAIKGFSIGGADAAIDNDAATVSLTLPYGTAVTALEPQITLADGAKIDKTGPQNFTSPVKYTVTSPDGKVQKTYTVTVKAQAKIKVACVGDSITAGAGGSGGINYPQQLGLNLGSAYEVRNFGNSGKTLLKDGIDGTNVVSGYVTTDTYRNSINYNPDVVIFMLGTNDSKPQNWNPLGDKFEDEYRELLQVYMNLPSHPTVYAATSPTAFQNGGYGIQPAVIHDEIVPIQKKIAAELGLTVIDMHALTADGGANFPDNIHPNNDGYIQMGKDFADAIKKDITTLQGFAVDGGANRDAALGVIDDEAGTVAITLPATADLTAVEPTLTLPAGATYAPLGAQDFSNPVTYTVTAADGTAKREYVVTAQKQKKLKIACVGDSMTFAEYYPNDLAGFLGGAAEIGRFGQNSTTAQKTGLKENGQNPNSGAYVDQAIYQQSKNFAPDIVLLTLGSNDSKQGVGEQSGHKLVVNWTENSPAQFEKDLKELVASYQALPSHPVVILGTSPSGYETAGNWGAKPQIVNDQIAPLQRKVAADMGCFLTDFNAATQGKETQLIGGDGLHPNFNGYYTLAGMHYVNIQNAMAAITGFAIGDEIGMVDQIDKTVYVSVPDGTDLTALEPVVTLAEGAVADKTGVQNFGQPVTYTVTSPNGWKSAYTVNVTSPSGVQVSKIELLTLPEKATYKLGEELDTTGATLSVIYTNGDREVIDVTADMVSGYDWLTVGKQALTVTYEGKTAEMTVKVEPYGVLGTFSAMAGKAHVLHNGENLLYADWKWIDQPDHKLDLSGYDLKDVTLDLDITFGSDQDNVNFQNFWHTLVIKLRSTDKSGVAGDPEQNNAEHNYGWNLTPSAFADPSKIHVSIPLNTPKGNSRGVMDWSEVGRIIIQCWFQDQYKNNSIDHYMDIQNVYILDKTAAPAAPDTAALNAAVADAQAVDTAAFTPASVAAFEKALEKAVAYQTNPYAAQEAVDAAVQTLTDAKAALESKPAYTPGDVDGKDGVTAADALMALQAATGKIELTADQTLAADVDGNAGVTAADALTILQYATGKIDTFPAAQADHNGLGSGDGVEDDL